MGDFIKLTGENKVLVMFTDGSSAVFDPKQHGEMNVNPCKVLYIAYKKQGKMKGDKDGEN